MEITMGGEEAVGCSRKCTYNKQTRWAGVALVQVVAIEEDAVWITMGWMGERADGPHYVFAEQQLGCHLTAAVT